MTDTPPRHRPKLRLPVEWLGILPFVLFALLFLILPTMKIVIGAFQSADGGFTLQNLIDLNTDSIRSAYKNVEANAEETLLLTLPADLRPTYEAILHGTDDEDDVYLRDLVKAADKISALIKCIDEAQAGNAEFRTAERSTRSKVDEMAARMPEVADFVREFLPSYGATLDQLL